MRFQPLPQKPLAALTAVVFLFCSVLSPWVQANAAENFRERRRMAAEASRRPPPAAAPAVPLSLTSAETAPAISGPRLSREHGEVVESYWPDLPASPESPLVIHVQDAHDVYAAQKNLAHIIEAVGRWPSPVGDRQPKTKSRQPLLVAAEGAWGPVRTRWLSLLPDRSLRNALAETWLKEAWITGEEFIAVAGDDVGVELVGAEDEALHRADVRARDDSRSAREGLLAFLSDLDRRAARLRPRLFSRSLQEMAALASSYRWEEEPLTRYLEGLRRLRPVPWSPAEYPHLSLLMDLSSAESETDERAISEEVSALVAGLAETLGPQAVAPLVREAAEVRAGRRGPRRLYRSVLTLARAAERQGRKVPPRRLVEAYSDRLERREFLDAARVSRETAALETDLRARLLESIEPSRRRAAAELARLEDWLLDRRRLLSLTLSPADWERRQEMDLPSWSQALSSLEGMEGAWLSSGDFPPHRPPAELVFSAESAAERFYRVAERRDMVLLENALAEARHRGASRLVLVAGGFHTPGITRLLRDRGLPYLVVRPQFGIPAPDRKPAGPAATAQTARKVSSFMDSLPDMAASAQGALLAAGGEEGNAEWMGLLPEEDRPLFERINWLPEIPGVSDRAGLLQLSDGRTAPVAARVEPSDTGPAPRRWIGREAVASWLDGLNAPGDVRDRLARDLGLDRPETAPVVRAPWIDRLADLFRKITGHVRAQFTWRRAFELSIGAGVVAMSGVFYVLFQGQATIHSPRAAAGLGSALVVLGTIVAARLARSRSHSTVNRVLNSGEADNVLVESLVKTVRALLADPNPGNLREAEAVFKKIQISSDHRSAKVFVELNDAERALVTRHFSARTLGRIYVGYGEMAYGAHMKRLRSYRDDLADMRDAEADLARMIEKPDELRAALKPTLAAAAQAASKAAGTADSLTMRLVRAKAPQGVLTVLHDLLDRTTDINILQALLAVGAEPLEKQVEIVAGHVKTLSGAAGKLKTGARDRLRAERAAATAQARLESLQNRAESAGVVWEMETLRELAQKLSQAAAEAPAVLTALEAALDAGEVQDDIARQELKNVAETLRELRTRARAAEKDLVNPRGAYMDLVRRQIPRLEEIQSAYRSVGTTEPLHPGADMGSYEERTLSIFKTAYLALSQLEYDLQNAKTDQEFLAALRSAKTPQEPPKQPGKTGTNVVDLISRIKKALKRAAPAEEAEAEAPDTAGWDPADHLRWIEEIGIRNFRHPETTLQSTLLTQDRENFLYTQSDNRLRSDLRELPQLEGAADVLKAWWGDTPAGMTGLRRLLGHGVEDLSAQEAVERENALPPSANLESDAHPAFKELLTQIETAAHKNAPDNKVAVSVPSDVSKTALGLAAARRLKDRQKVLYVDFRTLFTTPGLPPAQIVQTAKAIFGQAERMGDVTLILDLDAFQNEGLQYLDDILRSWKGGSGQTLVALASERTRESRLGKCAAFSSLFSLSTAESDPFLTQEPDAALRSDLDILLGEGVDIVKHAGLVDPPSPLAGYPADDAQIRSALTPLLAELLGKIQEKVPSNALGMAVRLMETAASAAARQPGRKDLRLTEKDVWSALATLPDTDKLPLELRVHARIKVMPPDSSIRKRALKELSDLANATDSGRDKIITYLERLMRIPWKDREQNDLNEVDIESALSETHFGMDRVKKVLKRFVALQKQTQGKGAKGQVLVFVGPAGTGKSTIAKQIAKALGRKYARVSLGGVDDESEIRGHRRTYVGSLPGRIVEAFMEAGTKNPVLHLDEIEKIRAARGDPASALLDVLGSDNQNYHDSYFEDDVDIDLSEALFIATANDLQELKRLAGGALADRFKIIQLPGYTLEDKIEIGVGHTLKKVMEELSLVEGEEVSIPDPAGFIRAVVEGYTWEEGVREMTGLIRDVLLSGLSDWVWRDEDGPVVLDEAKIREYLGEPRPRPRVAEEDEIGRTSVYSSRATLGRVEADMTPPSADSPEDLSIKLPEDWSKSDPQQGIHPKAAMIESAKMAAQLLKDHMGGWIEKLGLKSLAGKALAALSQRPELRMLWPEKGEDDSSKALAFTAALASQALGIPLRRDVALMGGLDLDARVLPVSRLRQRLLLAREARAREAVLSSHEDSKMELFNDAFQFQPVLRGAVHDLPAGKLYLPILAERKNASRAEAEAVRRWNETVLFLRGGAFSPEDLDPTALSALMATEGHPLAALLADRGLDASRLDTRKAAQILNELLDQDLPLQAPAADAPSALAELLSRKRGESVLETGERRLLNRWLLETALGRSLRVRVRHNDQKWEEREGDKQNRFEELLSAHGLASLDAAAMEDEFVMIKGDNERLREILAALPALPRNLRYVLADTVPDALTRALRPEGETETGQAPPSEPPPETKPSEKASETAAGGAAGTDRTEEKTETSTAGNADTSAGTGEETKTLTNIPEAPELPWFKRTVHVLTGPSAGPRDLHEAVFKLDTDKQYDLLQFLLIDAKKKEAEGDTTAKEKQLEAAEELLRLVLLVKPHSAGDMFNSLVQHKDKRLLSLALESFQPGTLGGLFYEIRRIYYNNKAGMMDKIKGILTGLQQGLPAPDRNYKEKIEAFLRDFGQAPWKDLVTDQDMGIVQKGYKDKFDQIGKRPAGARQSAYYELHAGILNWINTTLNEMDNFLNPGLGGTKDNIESYLDRMMDEFSASLVALLDKVPSTRDKVSDIWKSYEDRVALHLRTAKSGGLRGPREYLTDHSAGADARPAQPLLSRAFHGATDAVLSAVDNRSFRAQALVVPSERVKRLLPDIVAERLLHEGRPTRVLSIDVDRISSTPDLLLDSIRDAISWAQKAGDVLLLLDLDAFSASLQGKRVQDQSDAKVRLLANILDQIHAAGPRAPVVFMAGEETHAEIWDKMPDKYFPLVPSHAVQFSPLDRIALLREKIREVGEEGIPIEELAQIALEEALSTGELDYPAAVEVLQDAAAYVRRERKSAITVSEINKPIERARRWAQSSQGQTLDVALNPALVKLQIRQLPEPLQSKAFSLLSLILKSSEEGSERKKAIVYLQNLLRLPNKRSPDPLPPEAAKKGVKKLKEKMREILKGVKKSLDKNLHGMDKPKRKIMNHQTLRIHQQIKGAKRSGKALLIVSGPGQGKTTLGRDAAEAMGLEFVKVPLGGVSDPTEIHGHSPTYEDSRPGRIIQALQRAGTKNPVIFLDEIGKMVKGARGDPYAALLHVLDPEQNSDFRDHFIAAGYDLSEVTFIAATNTEDMQALKEMAPALLDRFEVVELPPYGPSEKIPIGRKMLDRIWEEFHITDQKIVLPAEEVRRDQVLDALVENVIRHTEETGVRDLERLLLEIVSQFLLESEEAGKPIPLQPGKIFHRDFLGPAPERGAPRERVPGDALGLAWRQGGGEPLDIQVRVRPSSHKGPFRLFDHGQMAEDMKESVSRATKFAARRIAEWIRTGKISGDSAAFYSNGLDDKVIQATIMPHDVPKAGPSAGVALAAALAGFIQGRRIKQGIAFTGALTTAGKAEAIGGLFEKILAAKERHADTIYLPADNEKGNGGLLTAVFPDNPYLRGIVQKLETRGGKKEWRQSFTIQQPKAPAGFTPDEKDLGRFKQQKELVENHAAGLWDKSEKGDIVLKGTPEQMADFFARQDVREIMGRPLTYVLVDEVDDILELVLEPKAPRGNGPSATPPQSPEADPSEGPAAPDTKKTPEAAGGKPTKGKITSLLPRLRPDPKTVAAVAGIAAAAAALLVLGLWGEDWLHEAARRTIVFFHDLKKEGALSGLAAMMVPLRTLGRTRLDKPGEEAPGLSPLLRRQTAAALLLHGAADDADPLLKAQTVVLVQKIQSGSWEPLGKDRSLTQDVADTLPAPGEEAAVSEETRRARVLLRDVFSAVGTPPGEAPSPARPLFRAMAAGVPEGDVAGTQDVFLFDKDTLGRPWFRREIQTLRSRLETLEAAGAPAAFRLACVLEPGETLTPEDLRDWGPVADRLIPLSAQEAGPARRSGDRLDVPSLEAIVSRKAGRPLRARPMADETTAARWVGENILLVLLSSEGAELAGLSRADAVALIRRIFPNPSDAEPLVQAYLDSPETFRLPGHSLHRLNDLDRDVVFSVHA